MKTTVDNVLRLAGVTLVDISLAEHQNGYTKLNIRMDNDRVVGASLTWSIRKQSERFELGNNIFLWNGKQFLSV